MAKALTAAGIARYKPGKERREIRDGAATGLYLILQESGQRSFALRFRKPNGKPAKLTLGPVDVSGVEQDGTPVLGAPLTLAGARALASEIHRQRAQGRDVIADHAASKHRRRTEHDENAANGFGALARQFIAEHAKPRTRRWRACARLLGLRYPTDGDEPEVIKGGLCERWGTRPVRTIDGHDIWAVVDETRLRGAPGLPRRSDGPTDGMARAMLAALSTVFTWLARRRIVATNPCIGIQRPDAAPARDRVLTVNEIVAFWQACGEIGEPIGQLLKLLLLTGCRLNEVAAMTRAELSDDGATWTIPSSRTKNKRAHVVPLPPLARAIIAGVKPIASAASYVFTTNGRSAISGWSAIKKVLDAAMGATSPWRLHDLRRTAATGMADIGIPPHIVEAALNHVSGAKAGVAGTYNRAAYANEKRAALERWALHIERLVSSGEPDKVVNLHGHRQVSSQT
jgi:integrase